MKTIIETIKSIGVATRKGLVVLVLALATLTSLTDNPVKDEIQAGFSNVRGFSTVRVKNPCTVYQITEAGSGSLDWNNGCVQRITMNESLTWAASNWTNGPSKGNMFLVVTSSISSPGTITWPSTVTWASASQNAPRLSGAGNIDIFNFISIASGSNNTYYGSYTAGVESAPQ